ncbi:hypothetical protein QCA50_014044 [Cerrena zonata]|uniref:Uncharacterized protein n=1 Tax=Cerrena zonata TaxID=2478898 RepID=A0AAW0FPA1_9APHY
MSKKSPEQPFEPSSLEKGERTAEYNDTTGDHQRTKGLSVTRLLLPVILFLCIKVALGSRDSRDTSEPMGTIVWNPCQGPNDLPGSECGHIIVPKDYFDPTVGTVKVALGRLKAVTDRQGIVLFNPGGPGAAAKSSVTTKGNVLQQRIGDHYDIIGFDPRGIGETVPAVRCFNADFTYNDFKRNTVLDRSYDFASNQTFETIRALVLDEEREVEALLRTAFAQCVKTMGNELKYMGTTTVTRDIDFITRTLEGDDALINFYGGSYGSVIGQYLVNMFPDRVGRVVIDAISDATLWTGTPPYRWYRTKLVNSEPVYRTFISECFKAGSEACALAKETDADPQDIDARLESFHNSLLYNPLPVPDATMPGVLTAGRSRTYLTTSLETPSKWPMVAQLFDQAMSGNGTGILSSLQQPGITVDLERPAVTCNDVQPFSPPSTEQIVDEYLFDYYNVTRFIFGILTSEPDAGCQYWPFTPPERFNGPWDHVLNNPILILSSEADPLTPAGKRVNELLHDSSRLLIRQGPGHGSLSFPSACIRGHLTAYFESGTLPPEGTVCPLEGALFPKPSVVGEQ